MPPSGLCPSNLMLAVSLALVRKLPCSRQHHHRRRFLFVAASFAPVVAPVAAPLAVAHKVGRGNVVAAAFLSSD